ncbi:hypothetical protein LOD99_2852 [Oopsacas minuta]|uniref:Uncharacterized protein n=1 Tax=Oopsacas minuta TaxID=111878 RepID=A0AAV7K137_9METZ|nr:hypothetical protein LOD99_2852 [Oopsacas minuta]
MSELDNNCHVFYSSNGTVSIINLKMQQPPTLFGVTIGTVTSPFNDDVFFLYCPLYGQPALSYNWSIPIAGAVWHLNITTLADYKDSNEFSSGFLSSVYMYANCPSAVQILYDVKIGFEGAFHCTGTNEFGSKTVLVTILTDSNVCVTQQNPIFSNSSNRIFQLESNRKVLAEEIGGNITVDCKFTPFSKDIILFWVRTGNLSKISNICTSTPDPYILTSDDKYTITDELVSENSNFPGTPNCTKSLSITIHEFHLSDEGAYSCVAVLCTTGFPPKVSSRDIEITGDRETRTLLIWLFSLISLPVLLIIISLVTAGILMYLNKVRLIRWYIAWKIEDPIGQFEYDAFICTPEEYDHQLVTEVTEVFEDLQNIRILWSEHDQCILAGRSHVENAVEIMEKCKKFIFIVDTKFVDCFFCKQLVELVVEKSSVKNWNIILPVKWYQHSIVPDELLVYRYVDREDNQDYLKEISSFMEGRNAARRNVAHGYELLDIRVDDRSRPLLNV